MWWSATRPQPPRCCPLRPHTAQLYLSGSLSLLALGGLAVSYPAIATLVRGRGWVIATAAALLGAVGAFCGLPIILRDHATVRGFAGAAAVPVRRGTGEPVRLSADRHI